MFYQLSNLELIEFYLSSDDVRVLVNGPVLRINPLKG